MTLSAAATADLLARYDRPGPRYTSYPTAVEFNEGFTSERYLAKLAEAATRPDEPLALYVHLPFCAERCSFCGCNVIITRKRGVAERYLDHLEREIDLVADRLGARTGVVQLHWGGGTPTYLNVDELQRLWDTISRRFTLLPGAEVAIEVDPRVTSAEQVERLMGLGFNRFSMGVQDFDPAVQDAIGRWQTFEQTETLHAQLRAAGIASINHDLVYGLPQQTPETFRDTIARTVDMRPDRVAVYSYAFVPWIKAHQKQIHLEDLPPREVKLELFGIAYEGFVAAGYEQIGMDHFALPSDALAQAARDRTLHRNFMGYTTNPAEDSIGFGVSAIGEIGGAFAQNTKKLTRYEDAVMAGVPPVERGFERSRDDTVRRDVIQSLMCNFHLDVRAIERRHQVVFRDYFADALAELEAGPVGHGFVRVTPDAIDVTQEGRLFVRNVCMAFDAYLKRHEGETQRFSRTV
ncbi:MAG: oxygen-independent coproporphyrinogen III oxidase [Trueperaceae bacterium]|nr:MAG: oxygen-independent coproporphyrinogen III oxidase [Trueperaceae bacterium]